jgi:hypothetical protein
LEFWSKRQSGGVEIESVQPFAGRLLDMKQLGQRSEKRWLLSNSGIANFAASGKRLGATTFVIQNVEMSDSIYRAVLTVAYTPSIRNDWNRNWLYLA